MPLRRLRPTLRAILAAAPILVAGSARADDLSADQAVSRAATNSPTLRAALLDRTAARQSLSAEEGARNPTFVASVQGEYTETLQFADDGRDESKTVTGNAGVRFLTDIGTTFEVGVDASTNWGNRFSSNFGGSVPGSTRTQTSFPPVYDARVYVTARQPLLRGGGTDAALAPIEQARSSAQAAEKQRDLAASQTALDTLGAYWELWYADRAITVQEQALAAAQRQVRDAKARANVIGTGSQIDVLQFATQEASIADSLSQARATRQARALELGRILGMNPSASTTLRAVGEPPESKSQLAPPDAISRAILARSNELEAMRADLAATRARVAAAEDANQAKLDLFATGSMGGRWTDDQYIGLALPGTRPVFSIVGGAELELPFGGGRQKHDAARARTQLAAAEARYQARVNAVLAEASSLRVNLEASAQQIELATLTAKMAGQLADAERQRMQIGTTTSADVVKAEQTAREAELRHLRAIVSRATSELQLDNATGSLLDRYASVIGGRSK